MILSLNMYLIKNEVKEMLNVLSEEYRTSLNKDLKIPNTEDSALCIKNPIDIDPEWYELFKGHPVAEELPSTMTNPSGVLLIKNQNGIFAITFGHGRFMLNLSTVLPDFGLKVCLNSLGSDRIKTVDTRALEQLTMHTKKQAVVPLDFNAFEVETERDMMRSVEGYYKDIDGEEKFLKGSAALVIRTEVNLNNLSLLCSKFHKIYKKDTYKEEFGWIDNIKLIADEEKINKLNLELENLLNSENLRGIFLGAPEIIDDSKVHYYKLSHFRENTSVLFPDIRSYISHYKNKFKQNANLIAYKKITTEQIKTNKIRAIEKSPKKDKEIYSWSVYDCICAEIKDKNVVNKLIEGNWYEIDSTYLAGVEDAIVKIQKTKISLPSMKVKETEEDYNIRASIEIKAACMDQEFIKIKGRSKFEFCDIFTRDKHIIHIKKHTGAPAISHLLYQAYVSGMLFSSEPTIRTAIAAKKVIKDLNYASKVNPASYSSSNFEIVIAIATHKTESLEKVLTFFSKISLAHKYKVLKSRGYNVSVKLIAIVLEEEAA